MMRLLSFVLISTIAGCAVLPATRPASPREASDGTGRLQAIELPRGRFSCDVLEREQRRPCREVPVLVLTNDDGSQCLTLLPFHELKIYAAQLPETLITWKLIGPPGYSFDETDGIKLKQIDGGVQPAESWEGKQRLQADVFQWRLRRGAPGGPVQHFALVRDRAGKLCETQDPIVNPTPN